MHSLATLVADITALLKTSGDSGDTGDRRFNKLKNNSKLVTTHADDLSPLINRVVTAENSSGDKDCDSNQLLNGGVTTVTSVTTHLRRGRAPTLAPGNVAEWHAILNELTAVDPPDWASSVRWQNMLSDADALLSQWGDAADQLGWTALDLFGVHPNAPADRYDVMGLLLVVQGGDVVSLTAETATIRRPSNAVLTYSRANAAGGILVTKAKR